MRPSLSSLLCSIVFLSLPAWAVATPVGTAFTYQGHLAESGGSLNGTVDFVVSLWDAPGSGSPPTGGELVAGALQLDNVAVTGGVFTLTIDFGQDAFGGEARWLEISVRSPHDPSDKLPFTTLAPRQAITPAPQAMFALESPDTGGDGHWTLARTDIFNNNTGNVGIGTNAPGTKLDVAGSVRTTNQFISTQASGTPPLVVSSTSRVTNLNAHFLDGVAMTAFGRLAANQTWTGAHTFSNAGNSFTGSGAGLTGLNASSIGTGTLSDARLSANIARRNAENTFTLDNYFNGLLGIGTTTPESRLDVRGSVTSQQTSGNNDNFTLKKTGDVGPTNVKFTLSHRSNGTEAWMYTSNGSVFRNMQGWDSANNRVRFPANGNTLVVDSGNGRVGAGILAPVAPLHVETASANDQFYNPAIYGKTTSNVDFHTVGVMGESSGLAGRGVFGLTTASQGGTGVFGQSNGSAGIGVYGEATSASGAGSGVRGVTNSTTGSGVYGLTNASSGASHAVRGFSSSPDGYSAYFTGVDGSTNYFQRRVGIGTSQPQTMLDVSGATRTRILTITGGADLAEKFEVETSEGDSPVEPGMVVVINPESPGHLMVSRDAYDKRVAGVISGAGGLSPGMVMSAEGDAYADGGQHVALTGRVWCWCDASSGAIEPGDMLTTSTTSGHAMKVQPGVDAHGAVLGKAMTPLADGEKGLVLILVTLQ